MLILFTVLTAALCVLVIFMNMESWPARIVGLLVVAAGVIFLPGGTKPIGLFGLVIVLSAYQSWSQRGDEEEE